MYRSMIESQGLGGDVDYVQVVAANEGDEFAVRAEGGQLLCAGSLGQSDGPAAIQVAVIEIVPVLEESGRALRIHVHMGGSRQALCSLRTDRG